jgi:DNA-directed RNA polymerase subunit RPC12/RpoP
MATFAHTCAGCGKRLAIPERYVGRDLKCPTCGAPFRVAPPEEPAPAPTPPPLSAAEPFSFASAPETAPLPASDEAPAASVDTTTLPEVSYGGAVYWRLRRIGVLSAALVSAVTNAVLGLGVALAFALAAGFLKRLAPALNLPFRGGLTLMALPLAYAVIGFVGGAIGAAVYNLAARFTGGLRIHLE